MNDISIYDIFERLEFISENEELDSVRKDCIIAQFDDNDNIPDTINYCSKIVRDVALKFIKNELVKNGFSYSKVNNKGEAFRTLHFRKEKIDLKIEYRMLANNRITVQYEIENLENKKKRIKKLSSMKKMLEDIRRIKDGSQN